MWPQYARNYAAGYSEAPGASMAPGTYSGGQQLPYYEPSMSGVQAFLQQLAMARAQQDAAQRAQFEQMQRAAQAAAAANSQNKKQDQGGMMAMLGRMFGGGQDAPQVPITGYAG